MTFAKITSTLHFRLQNQRFSFGSWQRIVAAWILVFAIGCEPIEVGVRLDGGVESAGRVAQVSAPIETEAISQVSDSATVALGADQEPDGKIDEELMDVLDSLKSHYPAVRIDSLKKLGEWNVEAGSPELQRIAAELYAFRADEYNDYEDQFVDQAFRKMDAKAVSEVERLVASKDDDNIMQAVIMMRSLGEAFTKKLTPAIEDLLNSNDPSHVWQGLYTLEGMGSGGKAFLDDVIPQINSSDFQAQQIALRVLATIGPDAKEALAEVRRLADEGQNISVKSHAMIAMGNIAAGAPEAESVAQQLLGYLDANNFVSKQRALTGLIALKKDAVVAQEQAKLLMEKDKTGLAAQGAYLYGLTSQNWETAAGRLGELARDPTVCFEALDFLKRTGPEAKAATEMLLTMTRSDDESLATPAVQALIAIYAQPEKDDRDFQRVASRFAELAGDVNETGYIAEQQVTKWKQEGIMPKSE